jgi:hypothetical protein
MTLTDSWLSNLAQQIASLGQGDPLWTPRSQPQTDALASLADETFYGGQAGGGKTDLLLGLALTQHRKSVIFRREYRQLADIERRGKEIIEDRARFNGTKLLWTFADGRSLELGAAQHPDDVRAWRGRPHDFKGFDEMPEFTEQQYLFLSGWARTTVKGQRVRRVGAGNPPSNAEGEWVIIRWAPWLDPQHENPAAPGELRWFVRLDDKDVEVESGEPFDYHGEMQYPQSRTFIPASLADNPFLSADPSYRATLQAMPEPLRSQLLLGSFATGMEDDPRSVIPSSWVREAQARWTAAPPCGLTAYGVDVARGGKDKTVLAPRHGNWFGPLKLYPGADTPDGESVARLLLPVMTGEAVANVDVVGIGASAYDVSRMFGLNVWPVNAGAGAKDPYGQPLTDRSGRFPFVNVRAAMYWALREALDPSLESTLMLPPSRTLAADLSAAKWSIKSGRIAIEDKDDVKTRLGRSPDEGDAVALAYWMDPAYLLSRARQQQPRRRQLVMGR